MTDRELIEHVATSTQATEFPAEFAGDPAELYRRLIRLGGMETPHATTLMSEVNDRARAGAKAWLERNPA